MACSLAAAFVGAMIAAAWPTYPGLCIAALLEGGAIAVAVVALQRHAGRLASGPGELRRVFAWVSFTPAASNFFGPFVAGLAIDGLGFRAAFLLLGAGPLASWIFVRGLRDLPKAAAALHSRPSARELWRNPTVRRVLLMNWFVSSTWDVHGVMVPLLGHTRGLSATSIGSILGAFAVAAALVRLLVPWLGARFREWALMTAALATAAVLLAVYPLMLTAVTMGACSFLIGIAVGGVQPLVMSLLHQITPPDRHGQAVALRLVMINASSISMPLPCWCCWGTDWSRQRVLGGRRVAGSRSASGRWLASHAAVAASVRFRQHCIGIQRSGVPHYGKFATYRMALCRVEMLSIALSPKRSNAQGQLCAPRPGDRSWPTAAHHERQLPGFSISSQRNLHHHSALAPDQARSEVPSCSETSRDVLAVLRVRTDAQCLGLGELVLRGHAAIAGMGVAPDGEGVHAAAAAGSWLMCELPGWSRPLRDQRHPNIPFDLVGHRDDASERQKWRARVPVANRHERGDDAGPLDTQCATIGLPSAPTSFQPQQ